MSHRHAVGLDFGTESVRVIVVRLADGRIVGQADQSYRHGVIDRQLPDSGRRLPPDYALQHPQDWLDAAGTASRRAIREARIDPQTVIGIGVDFTSCTMLPALADGTPLCLLPRFAREPLAWPKLWKHHGAKAETDRINQIAAERREPWLARYGGTIGIEWFFPKVLETLNHAPRVYDATQVWLEAGDWFVWQLIDGPFPRCRTENLVRSTCQAGYKAMWNRATGYPSADYFSAVHPKLSGVVGEKMPGRLESPGRRAGALTKSSARLLGLPAGTPVSVPAAVPGRTGERRVPCWEPRGRAGTFSA